MTLAILVLSIAIITFISSLVLANDYTKKANRTLAYLSVAFAFWLVANYLADKTSPLTLFWNRATFIGPIFILLYSYSFVAHIAGVKTHKRANYFFIGGSAFFALLCLTGAVVSSVYPRYSDGHIAGYNIRYGMGYWLVIVWILAQIVRFVVQLTASRHEAKGQLKTQLDVIIFGAIIAIAFALTTNVLLPNILNNTVSSQFAPITSVIFMGSLAFGIFKHGLFDIRVFVARSLGYAASLIVMAAVYGFVVFGIAQYVFHLQISTGAQIFISLTTAFAGLAFQRVKRSFDKATNKLFYRDAYDPQLLIDSLNKILVSTIDLEVLLTKSSTLLADSIKSEYCVFGLRETENTPQRVIGTAKVHVDKRDVDQLRKLTPGMPSVILTDYLTAENAALKRILSRNNVAALVRLAPEAADGANGFGYIVLGPKRSGNPYSQQDVRILDTIANELIIAIQNAMHFEEIQNFNITLQQKVDEATRKLRRTNAKLEALDETKDDFISMASHQLRTPLTSVKGYLSMVLEGDAGKVTPLQRKMLSQAFTSSQRMVYLIADLLNVSRLKTGKFVIEPTPTNLAQIVSDEIAQLVETAAGRELTLTYKKPEHFPSLMLDETKTRQVIMNFIDNAIYYTPAGGHIEVKLIDKPDSIELRVVDDGMGVPKSEQHHLFTKFYRAANARQARPDGTGLGLFMARKVVVAQGGIIIFESKEGKGSTFGFAFSKSKLSAPSTPPASVPFSEPLAKKKQEQLVAK